MALNAHDANGSHSTLDYPTQTQPQWQQTSSHESDQFNSSEPNQTTETSRSVFSGQSSEPQPQSLEREHSIALPTLNQQPYYDLDPSSRSVPLKHGSGPMATAPFLKDFSLVAEAARRAQMAVMMREMEGVKL